MTLLARTLLALAVTASVILVVLRLSRPDLVAGQELGSWATAGCALLFAFFLAELKGFSLGAGSVSRIIALCTWASIWVLLDLALGIKSFGTKIRFEDHWWLILAPGAAVFYWIYQLQRYLRSTTANRALEIDAKSSAQVRTSRPRRNHAHWAERKKNTPRPLWKQIVAVCCLIYFIAVWILPIFMAPFVNVLPFIHQSDFHSRLAVSMTCSFLLLGTLYFLDTKNFVNFVQNNESSLWKSAGNLIGISLGFILFSFYAAALSPNFFGALTRIFPSSEYEHIVEVESVEFSGPKYRSADLTLRGESDKKKLYLVLSKRLFDYPRFNVGDVIKLRGLQNFVGVYVTDFNVIGSRLKPPSRGPPSAATKVEH